MLKRMWNSSALRFVILVAVELFCITACRRRSWVILLDLPTQQMSPTDRKSTQSLVSNILIRRLKIAGAHGSTVEIKDETELVVKLGSNVNAERLHVRSLLTARGQLEVRVAFDDRFINQISSVLESQGMTLSQFSDQLKQKSLNPSLAKLLPKDSLLIPIDNGHFAIVENRAPLTGSMIEDVRITQDYGGEGILIKYGPEGRKRLEEMTRSNIGKSLAFILDGTVLIMPVIRAPISDGLAMLEGKFTSDDLRYLTAILNAGEMPVQPRIVSSRY